MPMRTCYFRVSTLSLELTALPTTVSSKKCQLLLLNLQRRHNKVIEATLELHMEYFQVVDPLDLETFLSATRTVLECSLMVLFPFGLPAAMRLICPTEELFIEAYGPRFRTVMEYVSEIIYEMQSINESQMSVTIHKLVTKEKNPQAVEAMQNLSDALKSVYSPPIFLDLPRIATLQEISNFAVEVLEKEAFYSNIPKKQQEVGIYPPTRGFCDVMYPEVFVSLGYSYLETATLPTLGAMEGQSGDMHVKEKSVKMLNALKFCMTKLHGKDIKDLEDDDLLKSVAIGKEYLKQNHLQALVEWYKTSSPSKFAQDLDVIATAENACFVSDPLFYAIVKIQNDERFTDMLDMVCLAERYKAAAVMYSERCDFHEAARLYEKAFFASFGFSPLSRSAHFLARCANIRLSIMKKEKFLDNYSVQSALIDLESALKMDECCAGAWLGKATALCMMESFENESMLKEILECMVKAFVLDVCGIWSPVEEQAAAIEEIAREVCKSEAHELFFNRPMKSSEAIMLPPDWLMNSYFESFSGEKDGSFYRKKLPILSQSDPTENLINLFSKLEIFDFDLLNEINYSVSHSELLKEYIEKGRTLTKDEEFLYDVFSSALLNRRDGKHLNAMLLFGLITGALENFVAGKIEDSKNGTNPNLEKNQSNRGIEGEPNNATLLILASAAYEQLASYVYLLGDMKAAERGFQTSAKLDKLNSRPRVKLASLMCDMGNKSEALQWFEYAQKANPDNRDVYLHRGQFFLLTNSIELAVQELEFACRNNYNEPILPCARASLGMALFKLGMTDEPYRIQQAMEIMRDTTEMYPENMEVAIFYSEMLTQTGDLGGALNLLKKASQRDPSCPLPYVNAGRAFMSVGDLHSARVHLDKAIEIDPQCSGAYLDLGQVEMKAGFVGRAMDYYKKGIKYCRYLMELHDALACYTISKHHLEAKEYFQVKIGRSHECKNC